MNAYNVGIFKEIFNWHILEEISEKQISIMAKKLNFTLNDQFSFKSTWNYYKKFTIFSINKVPLLFLKYVRENYIFEVLGIHLTRNFFDPELGFTNYLTGLYIKKRVPIPYLITTYEQGKSMEEYNVEKFKFQLGRLCYIHEALSLYDVYDRHFIVKSNNVVCRIDFGRCFENVHKKYLGFHDYLNEKRLDFYDAEFQEGYNQEKKIIRKSLISKKRDFFNMIRFIKTLEQDGKIVNFDSKKFANELIDHWSKIGFLIDAGIEECQCI